MDMIQIESDGLAIVLIILAALIPIGVIWFTIWKIRKKRETSVEKSDGLEDNLKSVKEDRLEKSGKKGK